MTTARSDTTSARLSEIVAAAVSAARPAAEAPDETRARWLEIVADHLDAAAADLIPLADTESHLGVPRLTGELARTTSQLRLFAAVVREGSYLEAVIDHANAAAVPAHGDIRRLLVPIGPVAVFAASNFPFAFSVAGGDTASALAVGCPVVVKAHPGHPELSARVASVVGEALTEAGAPAGVFGMVEGQSAGVELVTHPSIRAVGFTGSVAGGRALFDLASRRPDPIPFYGELGSVNPVVITPTAVAARGAELGQGLAASFTMGAGQFCTKPGVVFVPSGAGFEEAVLAAVPQLSATLLTPSIRAGFGRGAAALAADPSVTVLMGDAEQEVVEGSSGDEPAGPLVLATDVAAVIANPGLLLEECFGPVTLLVRYDTTESLLEGIRAVPGSLTATLHSEERDDVDDLVAALRDRAGRLLFRGWPTGVAVTWSQHHGGPYPSTTSIHTSVGATASRRFQRPVAYQDAPESVLPPALREGNPLRIVRRVDGVLGRA